MRAAIYCRQSRDDEHTGLAVERQEQACTALAQARGWTVSAVYIDNAVSASSGKRRPQWERLLEDVRSGEVDVIVAMAVDRITRSMGDLERLIAMVEETGTGIATATGDLDLANDQGRMLARILAAVARGEVERKAARQMHANRQRVSQGRPRWAHRPFGYEKDGSFRESEAQLLRQAYTDIIDGTRLHLIVKQWNSEGVTTSSGIPWTTQSLGKLLRDPRNIGKLRYQGKVVGTGNWTPLVSEDTYAACLHTLRRGPYGKGGRAVPSKGWLVSVARCAVCDGRIWATRKPSEKHPPGTDDFYTCPAGHIHLWRPLVDFVVAEKIAKAITEDVEAYWQGGDTDESIATLRAERTQIEDRTTELAEAFADGTITLPQLQAGTAKLHTRRDELDEQIGELSSTQRVPTDVDWFQLYSHLSLEKTPDQVRHWLHSINAEIKLHRRGKGSREPFTPSLVEVHIPPQRIYL